MIRLYSCCPAQAKEAKHEAKHAAKETKEAGGDAGEWVNEKSGGLLDSASDAAHKVGSKAHDAYDAVADKVRPPGMAAGQASAALCRREKMILTWCHGVKWHPGVTVVALHGCHQLWHGSPGQLM